MEDQYEAHDSLKINLEEVLFTGIDSGNLLFNLIKINKNKINKYFDK